MCFKISIIWHMKKVFIVHGFKGTPNGGWRPWLMAELEKQDIWAAALPLSNPDAPMCAEWVSELAQYIRVSKDDEIYLVGHSLGATAILRYLESDLSDVIFSGVILVSGLCESVGKAELENFLDKPFNFEVIKSKAKAFSVIHGDNDDRVPFTQAEKLAQELGAELTPVPNGGHLNGKSGWNTLPQCLEALNKMMS